ncbi:MAG: hypothetical protein ABSG43_29800 [Solirubrobacteraceae bacterium]|jgi:hypothetical protein
MTEQALAISGYGSDEPPISAQYPDAAVPPQGQGQASVVSNLGSVMRVISKAQRSGPKQAARLRVKEVQIRRSATAALASAPGLSPRQSGSVALLVALMAVLSVGGVLRWRRGRA